MASVAREITVAVHCGVHGRIAADLARITRESGVRILLGSGNKEVDCGSILEILSLGISEGKRIQVRVTGPSSESVLDRVCSLLTDEGH